MKLHKQAVRSIPLSFEQFTVSDDKNATGNTLTYARSKLSETWQKIDLYKKILRIK